jgi:hypothetical protein
MSIDVLHMNSEMAVDYFKLQSVRQQQQDMFLFILQSEYKSDLSFKFFKCLL